MLAQRERDTAAREAKLIADASRLPWVVAACAAIRDAGGEPSVTLDGYNKPQVAGTLRGVVLAPVREDNATRHPEISRQETIYRAAIAAANKATAAVEAEFLQLHGRKATHRVAGNYGPKSDYEVTDERLSLSPERGAEMDAAIAALPEVAEAKSAKATLDRLWSTGGVL